MIAQLIVATGDATHPYHYGAHDVAAYLTSRLLHYSEREHNANYGHGVPDGDECNVSISPTKAQNQDVWMQLKTATWRHPRSGSLPDRPQPPDHHGR